MLAIFLSTVLAQAPMTMTTVARGGMSNIMDAKDVVVRTLPEWQALWREHHGADGTCPVVDFAKQMVVGVFLGARNTGGYDVEITAVERGPQGLVVRYAERTPDRGSIVAQVITSPFHLVAVDKSDLGVTFERAAKPGR